MARTPVSASSRKCFPTRPIGAIFPTASCDRTKNTDTSASFGSSNASLFVLREGGPGGWVKARGRRSVLRRGRRLGERGANLKAELIHRGLLANRQIFTLGLTFGLLLRARDVDRNAGRHFGMELDRRLMDAEGLDGLDERNLVAANRKAGRCDRLGDIAARHRTIKLPRFAGLADDYEAVAVKLGGDALGFLLQFEIARLSC